MNQSTLSFSLDQFEQVIYELEANLLNDLIQKKGLTVDIV
jgi:hypothetical protein